MTENRPLRVGDPAPSNHGRTDEGTPVCLADFKGRCLAVFPLGGGFDRSKRAAVKAVAKKAQDFLDRECSPVVISTEASEILGSFRDSEELPYLLISDPEGTIHAALVGDGAQEPYGAWIFDDDGVLAATVHPMPVRELLTAAVAAVERLTGG